MKESKKSWEPMRVANVGSIETVVLNLSSFPGPGSFPGKGGPFSGS